MFCPQQTAPRSLQLLAIYLYTKHYSRTNYTSDITNFCRLKSTHPQKHPTRSSHGRRWTVTPFREQLISRHSNCACLTGALSFNSYCESLWRLICDPRNPHPSSYRQQLMLRIVHKVWHVTGLGFQLHSLLQNINGIKVLASVWLLSLFRCPFYLTRTQTDKCYLSTFFFFLQENFSRPTQAQFVSASLYLNTGSMVALLIH